MKGSYKYRLKYAKTDKARYISHLDFVRALNRTIRRSGLPVTYTEGFNPHPVMTVALPISVGVTSECEYMDIDFDDKLLVYDVVSGFNNAFPEGIRVIEGRIIGNDNIAFKHIDIAKYIVRIEMKDETQPDIDKFLGMDEIVVSKKSKSAVKDVDIKPDIFALKMVSHEGRFVTLEAEVSTGSSYNLKPELVVAAMEKYLDGFDVDFMQVHRVGVYAKGRELF